MRLLTALAVMASSAATCSKEPSRVAASKARKASIGGKRVSLRDMAGGYPYGDRCPLERPNTGASAPGRCAVERSTAIGPMRRIQARHRPRPVYPSRGPRSAAAIAASGDRIERASLSANFEMQLVVTTTRDLGELLPQQHTLLLLDLHLVSVEIDADGLFGMATTIIWP